MKISGCVFFKKNIYKESENHFEATYKGKRFCVTTDHGFGKPRYNHLKRFMIDVVDIKSGMYDVQSYEDFHNINEAISSALIGSMLYK